MTNYQEDLTIDSGLPAVSIQQKKKESLGLKAVCVLLVMVAAYMAGYNSAANAAASQEAALMAQWPGY